MPMLSPNGTRKNATAMANPTTTASMRSIETNETVERSVPGGVPVPEALPGRLRPQTAKSEI